MWTSGRCHGDDKTQHEHHWTSTWKQICWAILVSMGELKRMITWKLTTFLLDRACLFLTHQHEVQVASQKLLCKIIWINLDLYMFTIAKVRSILTLQGDFALNHAFRWDSMPSPPHLHPSHHTSCGAPNGLHGGDYHVPSSHVSVKNDPHIPKHQSKCPCPQADNKQYARPCWLNH